MRRSTPPTRRGGLFCCSIPAQILFVGLCVAVCGCGSFAARGLNADGVRRFEQAQYQAAIQQFQKAIYNDPDNADGYYNLAAVYQRLGKTNRNESQLKQAEHYHHMCLDRDMDHSECYRGLAVLLAEQNRREEAFRLIENWMDARPASPEPKVELARLFEEFGDREAAKEHLIEALAINPNHPRALAALGNLREQAGQHAQALADYQRSLWHDQFQPAVAARVASLQSRLNTGPVAHTPPGGTRTVTRDTSILR